MRLCRTPFTGFRFANAARSEIRRIIHVSLLAFAAGFCDIE
jgi:hypothetical protein